MLGMSLALVSTPGALVLGLWGGHRLAAGWLACAAMVWAVAGNREYAEWWYALLFYGPQLIAAFLFWRRAGEDASEHSFMPSAATPFHASPARRIAWSIALVVGCASRFAIVSIGDPLESRKTLENPNPPVFRKFSDFVYYSGVTGRK